MAGRFLLFMLIFAIKVYRVLLSPFVGGSCRFVPSCSRYAEDALRAYGPGKGTWMAICRVGRCHPWSSGGFDPIPRPGTPDARHEAAAAQNAAHERPVGPARVMP